MIQSTLVHPTQNLCTLMISRLVGTPRSAVSGTKSFPFVTIARISSQGAVFARSPQFLEGPVQVSFGHEFGSHKTAYKSGDYVLKCRSWKVFRITSRTLLWRHQHRGPSKAELVVVGRAKEQCHSVSKEVCTAD